MRCPSCGGYEWVEDKCKFCGYILPVVKPRFEPGTIDTTKYAKLLKEKEERERRDKIPKLSECSLCHRKSLYYNKIGDKFECLNLDCGK